MVHTEAGIELTAEEDEIDEDDEVMPPGAEEDQICPSTPTKRFFERSSLVSKSYSFKRMMSFRTSRRSNGKSDFSAGGGPLDSQSRSSSQSYLPLQFSFLGQIYRKTTVKRTASAKPKFSIDPQLPQPLEDSGLDNGGTARAAATAAVVVAGAAQAAASRDSSSAAAALQEDVEVIDGARATVTDCSSVVVVQKTSVIQQTTTTANLVDKNTPSIAAVWEENAFVLNAWAVGLYAKQTEN